MSSVIFQPLLHDPLGWKASNSTYADHYQWRKTRLTRKDKIVSPYGQKYQRQLQRDKEKEQERHLQRVKTAAAAVAFEDEQPIQRQASFKRSSSSFRPPSSKSAPAVLEDTSSFVTIASSAKSRPPSNNANRESLNASRTSQRSSTSAVANEETSRSSATFERRRSQREEPVRSLVDVNNDNSRHWLTYPNPKTPQHIIESRIRLGKLKTPAVLSRAKSALYASTEITVKTPLIVDRTESTKVSDSPKEKTAEQRHFLDFNLPDTPDDLRAARYRIDKHRFHPSLDNYPPRPQTCPVQMHDIPKVSPPTPALETEPEPNSTSNEENSNETEEKKTSDNDSSTILVQYLDMDGVPVEYVHALETANAVEEQYLKDIKENAEKRTEQFFYRLPAMTPETKPNSSKGSRQPTPTVNNALRQQDFGRWVRQATDQERNTAMKILQDVLNQPASSDDLPLNESASVVIAPPRTRSSMRKLGRVRTQPRFPVDHSENDLVQTDLWNIGRSDAMNPSHSIQASKTTSIRV